MITAALVSPASTPRVSAEDAARDLLGALVDLQAAWRDREGDPELIEETLSQALAALVQHAQHGDAQAFVAAWQRGRAVQP